jgi:hypothetical protein
METNQTLLRNQVAAKTRRIVERQGPLDLERFLAQGQKRSRQRRDPAREPSPQGCAVLLPKTTTA